MIYSENILSLKTQTLFLCSPSEKKYLIKAQGNNYYFQQNFKNWKVFNQADEEVVDYTVNEKPHNLEIFRLSYTDSKCRTNGVGKALVKQIVQYARSRNKFFVTAMAESPDHIKFLRQLGFQQNSPNIRQVLILRELTSEIKRLNSL